MVTYRHCLGEFEIDLLVFKFQSRTFGNTEGYIGVVYLIIQGVFE
jgi:hypothetical protein